MSIPVSDMSELYGVILGYRINASIFDMLTSVGIVYIPFVYMVVKSWLEARAAGSDEGATAIVALKKIEHSLYMMIFVYLFAVVPVDMSHVGASVKAYSYSCTAEDGKEKAYSATPSSGTAVNAEQLQLAELTRSGFQNEVFKIPLWWAMVHTLTVAGSNGVIASLPCEINLRDFSKDIQEDIVTDGDQRDAIAPFIRSCVEDARKRVKSLYPDLDSNKDEMFKYLAIDSQYMRDAYKQVPIVINNKVLNNNGASYAGAGLTGDDVKLNCSDVYEGGGSGELSSYIGVRNMVNDMPTGEQLNGYSLIMGVPATDTTTIQTAAIEQRLAGTALDIENSSWSAIAGRVGDSIYNIGANAVNSVLAPAKLYVETSVSAIEVMTGNTSVIENSRMGKAMALVGAYTNEVGARVELIGLKAAQPIILSLITTLFVLVLPILLTITGFSGKALLSLSGFYFALKFTPVVFAVGEWFDKVLVQAMQSEYSAYNMDGAMFTMMSDYIAVAAYQYMPMLWFVLVGIVGIQGAQAINQTSGAAKGGASAASEGVSKSARAGKAVATKGKSEMPAKK